MTNNLEWAHLVPGDLIVYKPKILMYLFLGIDLDDYSRNVVFAFGLEEQRKLFFHKIKADLIRRDIGTEWQIFRDGERIF